MGNMLFRCHVNVIFSLTVSFFLGKTLKDGCFAASEDAKSSAFLIAGFKPWVSEDCIKNGI